MINFFFIWLLILTISYIRLRNQHKQLKHDIQQMQQSSDFDHSSKLPTSSPSEEKLISEILTPLEPIVKQTDDIQPDEEVTPLDAHQREPEIQLPVDSQLDEDVTTGDLEPEESEVELSATTQKPLEVNKPVEQNPITSESTPKKRTKRDWEMLIGGRWLNWIGAVAVVIGLIFFIKYAFDQNLISNPMKVVIVTIIGLSLLWGGSFAHRKKLPVMGQGLIGVGVATLYLAVFAAHGVYQLVQANTSIVLMSIVTVLAVQQAMRYQSLGISLLAWVGGYVTPFLVSTDEASLVGFLSYLALLSAGMIWVAVKRPNWRILYPITLLATYLISVIFLINTDHTSQWLLGLSFLFVYWFIFHVYELLSLSHPQTNWRSLIEIIAAFHSLIIFVSIVVWLEESKQTDLIWISLLVLSCAYALPFAIKRIRTILVCEQLTLRRMILTLCILLNIAPVFEWRDFELLAIWVVQALVMTWWSTRKQEERWFTYYLASLLAVISLTLITKTSEIVIVRPIFNVPFLISLAVFGMLLFAATRPNLHKGFVHGFQVAWALLLFWSYRIAAEQIHLLLGDEYKYVYVMVYALGWMCIGLLLTHVAVRKSSYPLQVTAWAYLIISFLTLAVAATNYEILSFTTNLWIRPVILLVAIGILCLHYRLFKRINLVFDQYILFGAILLGFELITLQIIEYFDFMKETKGFISLSTTESIYAPIDYNRWNVLWLAWLLYALFIGWQGIRKKIPFVFKMGLGFFVICVAGSMLKGVQYEPLDLFVPVLNMRFLLILVAAVASFCFAKLFGKQGKSPLAFYLVALFLLFELINVEINDYFRKQLTQLSMADTVRKADLQFVKPLLLAVLGVGFSLLLTWIAKRNKQHRITQLARIILSVNLICVLYFGWSFAPIQEFVPLLNFRSLVFLLAVIVVYLNYQWSKQDKNYRIAYIAMLIVMTFTWLSIEINDGFSQLIFQNQVDAVNLVNMKQLAFSFSWLLYAIILFSLGLWRRFPALRWTAIGLMGLATCKIFLFDLSFLGTLYQIFLFIGLGLVLLIVSFVYQRYKHLFNPEKSDQN